MSWPQPQDYTEAIKNPSVAFHDPDLKAARPIPGADGLPLPRSGNCADVYQLRGQDGRDWAVKCFTRPVTGLEQRYAKIGEALRAANLPFTVGFTFLASGIQVRGQWFPVVKMEWVGGLLLSQVVRDNAGRPAALAAIGQMWGRLCRRLREVGIAHADLQHGNVLLGPGAKPGSYGLKLIDYDGMYVPALANDPSGEAGHPHYRHPGRPAALAYTPDLDRFSHLVVATALRALENGGTTLWQRYDTGDNMLFVENDFQAPDRSPLMRELWQTGIPAIRSLVGQLAIACRKPLAQTTWLDQIAPDSQPTPLDPETTRAAETALGLGATVSSVPRPAPTTPESEPIADAEVIIVEPAGPAKLARRAEPLPRENRPNRDRSARRPRPESQSDSNLLIVLFVAFAGLAALVMAGVAVALIVNDMSSTATTQADNLALTPPRSDPIELAPKGGALATFNPDPTGAPSLALRWETTTRSRVWIKTTLDNAWVLAYEPGSHAVRIFSSANGNYVGDFQDGTRLWEFIPLPEGMVVSWAPDQPSAVIWNVATRAVIAELPVGQATPLNGREIVFDVSPNGRYVATGFRALGRIYEGQNRPPDSEVRLYDSQAEREIVKFSTRGQVIRFTPDNQLMLAEVDRCRWLTLPDGAVASEIMLPRAAKGYVAAISPDGERALFSGDDSLSLIDTRTGRALAEFPGRVGLTGNSLSPDGQRLAVAVLPAPGANDRASYLEVIDLRAGRVVGRFLLDSTGKIDVTSTFFTPDSKAVALGRLGNRIQMLDLPTDRIPAPPKGP